MPNYSFPSGFNMPPGVFFTPYDRVECQKCNRIVDETEMTDVHGNYDYVCDECIDDYFQCKHCEEWYPLDDVSDEEDVCEDCFKENYGICQVCGKPYEIEDDEIKLCTTCGKDLEHL